MEAIEATHRFAVANFLCANATAKRMLPEMIHTLKALLSEEQRRLAVCVQVLPVVYRVSNAAYCEQYKTRPFKVVFGLEPGTPFIALLETSEDKRKMKRRDPTPT